MGETLIEIQITANGKVIKLGVTNQQLKLLNDMLKWDKETYYGDFTITKTGKDYQTKMGKRNVYKHEEEKLNKVV